MRNIGLFLLIVVSLSSVFGLAQNSTLLGSQAKPAVELTVDDVIKLVQAGLSEDLVIIKIKQNGKAFNLSTEQLLQLKKSSVSDNIIRTMLEPQAKPESTAVTTSNIKTTAEKVKSPNNLIPDEQGVYWFRERKELVRIEGSAVSNIRTGSTLVSKLTFGAKKARLNAQLRGARARLRIKESRPQFYLYLPEGASIGDYLLVKLAQRLDVRQLEMAESTFWKMQSGIDHKKQVDFKYKRIKPRLYLVTPNRDLDPGEYGFFVAAGIELKKPTGRIYDFGIDP